MKKIVILMTGVLIAGVVTADIAVDWKSGVAGAILDEGGVAPAGPFVEGGMIQLIWSATGITTVAGGGYGIAGGGMLAGEYLLDGIGGIGEGVTAAFGQWAGFGGIYDDSYVGGNAGEQSIIHTGFFFTRVFQTGAAGNNDWFVDITENQADKVYSASDTDTVYATGVLDSQGLVAIEGAGTHVIPEPATLGMMAVAGLGMFLARKKARR